MITKHKRLLSSGRF